MEKPHKHIKKGLVFLCVFISLVGVFYIAIGMVMYINKPYFVYKDNLKKYEEYNATLYNNIYRTVDDYSNFKNNIYTELDKTIDSMTISNKFDVYFNLSSVIFDDANVNDVYSSALKYITKCEDFESFVKSGINYLDKIEDTHSLMNIYWGTDIVLYNFSEVKLYYYAIVYDKLAASLSNDIKTFGGRFVTSFMKDAIKEIEKNDSFSDSIDKLLIDGYVMSLLSNEKNFNSKINNVYLRQNIVYSNYWWKDITLLDYIKKDNIRETVKQLNSVWFDTTNNNKDIVIEK